MPIKHQKWYTQLTKLYLKLFPPKVGGGLKKKTTHCHLLITVQRHHSFFRGCLNAVVGGTFFGSAKMAMSDSY